MNVITRIVQLGYYYHAIVLDRNGKIHHEIFAEKRRAISYVEAHYHDHREVISYKV